MADPTYTERLTECRAAISALMTGGNQSASAFGRSWTKVELSQLVEYEKYLAPKAAREAAGGTVRVQQVVPL